MRSTLCRHQQVGSGAPAPKLDVDAGGPLTFDVIAGAVVSVNRPDQQRQRSAA